MPWLINEGGYPGEGIKHIFKIGWNYYWHQIQKRKKLKEKITDLYSR